MTGTVRVRRAVIDDAEAIGAVHTRAWRESYAGLLPDAAISHWTIASRAAMWHTAIRQGTARGICVAEQDGMLIGFGA